MGRADPPGAAVTAEVTAEVTAMVTAVPGKGDTCGATQVGGVAAEHTCQSVVLGPPQAAP